MHHHRTLHLTTWFTDTSNNNSNLRSNTSTTSVSQSTQHQRLQQEIACSRRSTPLHSFTPITTDYLKINAIYFSVGILNTLYSVTVLFFSFTTTTVFGTKQTPCPGWGVLARNPRGCAPGLFFYKYVSLCSILVHHTYYHQNKKQGVCSS